ncbi:cyclin 6 pcl7 [Cryptosporidium canis]|uniref:Cyclin 6 pcl7 n=1 Tax=Cryptosporidium canis TaxID=195482 RepID=A0A9D5DHI2_9CRYT|nr:cyclin 6 pcl7 [Cryptosporidium canis]
MEECSEVETKLDNISPTESYYTLKDSRELPNGNNTNSNYLNNRVLATEEPKDLNKPMWYVPNSFMKSDLKFLLQIINAENNSYSMLNKIKPADLTKNYQIFENIRDDEGVSNLGILHSFPNYSAHENNTTNIHDSALMDKYSFSSVMNDIIVILHHLPTRRAESLVHTLFDSALSPPISIKSYFMRLSEFFLCSPSLFIIMFIYIKRIIQNNPSYCFDSKNAHRLMLATLVISVKLYDDKLLPNSHYAQVGGVTESELSRLEVNALLLMDFRLFVSIEEFVNFSYSLRFIGETIKIHGINFNISKFNIIDINDN